MRNGDHAFAVGTVPGIIDRRPPEPIDATVAWALAFRAKLHSVTFENDVGLGIAIASSVDRLVTRRGKERDLQILVARISHTVFAGDGMKLVVRWPELDDTVDRFRRLRVLHGKRRFTGRLDGLTVAVACFGGDHDVVSAHSEGSFIVEREVDLLTAFRKLA